MPQFGVVGESETVLLGCLIKEHLRLWRSDARGECVRPLHPSALREFLARGLAPRRASSRAATESSAGSTPRACSWWGSGRSPSRPASTPKSPMRCGRPRPKCSKKRPPPPIARGEYIVVEPGGWEPTGEIYAVAGARRTPGGEWFLYVEAAPAPRAPSWPEPPEGRGRLGRHDARRSRGARSARRPSRRRGFDVGAFSARRGFHVRQTARRQVACGGNAGVDRRIALLDSRRHRRVACDQATFGGARPRLRSAGRTSITTRIRSTSRATCARVSCWCITTLNNGRATRRTTKGNSSSRLRRLPDASPPVRSLPLGARSGAAVAG